MRASRLDSQPVISERSLEEVVQLLVGKRSTLEEEPEIRFEVALQALDNGCSLLEIVAQAAAQVEGYILLHVLGFTNGNKVRAAKILQIDYKTLYRKLHKYLIEV